MYNPSDIWFQALDDEQSHKQFTKKVTVILGKSVRLQKFENSYHIEFYNLNKGGDYYKLLDEQELQLFLDHGWKAGQIHLIILNCIFKLNLIEQKIKTEVNTRKNDKHIQNLKTRREGMLVKYTKNQRKLNKLKLN